MTIARTQCDVSGATLTEIEGPGTSSGAYGRGGGAGGGREGGTGRGTRGKEVSPPVKGGGDGLIFVGTILQAAEKSIGALKSMEFASCHQELKASGAVITGCRLDSANDFHD